MRFPKIPPSFQALKQTMGAQEILAAFVEAGKLGPVDEKGQYLHWDDLQHREMPEGHSREMVWLRLKAARDSARINIPLKDQNNKEFGFTLFNGLLRGCSHIDKIAGGSIGVTDLGERLTDDHARKTFSLKSRIDEAFMSSRIEGAAATRIQAENMILSGNKPRDRSERMILNNYRAMEFIREIADQDLSMPLLLRLHEIITQDTLDKPDAAGRTRTKNDGKVSVVDGDEEIVYTPPSAEFLPDRLKALFAFANYDYSAIDSPVYIHPVIQAFILHFMINYEHPFVDGNGRTGRALFYWLMIKRGYWLVEFISISNYIYRAVSRYSRSYLLTETDGSDLTYFILDQFGYLERAFEDFYTLLRRKEDEIHRFNNALRHSEYWTTLNSRQKAILTQALEKPGSFFTIKRHQKLHGISYLTARSDFLELERNGLFLHTQQGRRYYFHAAPNLQQKIRP